MEEKTTTATEPVEAPAPPEDFEAYQAYRNAGDKLPEATEETTPEVAATQPPAETAPESEPESKEQEVEAEADDATEEKHEKKEGGFQKRIRKLNREKAELEQQVAALRQSGTASPAVTPVPDKAAAVEGEPTPDAFDTYEQFSKAQIKFELDARDKAKEAEAARKTAAEAQRAVANTWTERETKSRTAHADYDDVLESAEDLKIPQHMTNALLILEEGPELAYALAKDRPTADRIAAIRDPLQTAIELGKFAAKLANPTKPAPKTPAPVTRAPKPVTPLSSGKAGPAATSVYDETLAGDYNEWENERRAQLKR